MRAGPLFSLSDRGGLGAASLFSCMLVFLNTLDIVNP